MVKKRVGVLVSGRGSNLQALLDACADPAFPAEIVLVLSNVPGAYALERAEQAKVATVTISHKGFPGGREAFDAAMDVELRKAGVDIVCLAGFMRLLSPGFVQSWAGRMINIHPSLLPSFKGLHTHAQALAAGVKLHGCTVHLVTPDLDDGPILVQAAVPVLADDSEESLAARVLEQEHKAYPLALRLIAEGKVAVDGNRAKVEASGFGALVNPVP
ncbi:phosphoribosylglycinamide formyltransferase [Magnetospirillum gryphiswaldense]|uniref:Phosphoribosylglycinamide formyltransferase n=1 Tax=Magnetospirillum gryphiswaldense TaxID=55518 RepID=A4TZI2_9PROT|nr:phosphoribosylglycinamide formyltransferase [Magnetospirillum gryphiswaldense]AVM74315.1 Phosphoribosylglycinamide formyltransferase [Magnetospirillum gryphiswaldense MSR-1]AVM78218.1 Phosphoribosylglycinamide formyltransferase [Magnetospirillum gryphiswaldense]CAM76039.1 Folate-dependent phosphoribosylglycinamide formyltransferase PurN [Magnetospirillum gryphiswaldense MSR-1]